MTQETTDVSVTEFKTFALENYLPWQETKAKQLLEHLVELGKDDSQFRDSSLYKSVYSHIVHLQARDEEIRIYLEGVEEISSKDESHPIVK